MAKQHSTNPVFLCIIILFHAFCMSWDLAGAQPAGYIFGDSLVDVGTNNYVDGALATANNPYYGIDYKNSIATGRFSNGYNLADYIGTFRLHFILSSLLFFFSDRYETLHLYTYYGVWVAVKLTGVCNESPPPFLQLVQSQSDFQSKIQQGVNFASGGAGILDQSGFQLFVWPFILLCENTFLFFRTN